VNPTKLLRSTVGLSQDAFAVRVGTSQSAIAAYEAGRKQPTWRTLERMAERVGLEAHVWFAPPMGPADCQAYVLHTFVAAELRVTRRQLLRRARVELEWFHRRQNRIRLDHPAKGLTIPLWTAVLALPEPELVATILDPGEFGRTLRRESPFTRIVSRTAKLTAAGAGSLSRYRHRGGE